MYNTRWKVQHGFPLKAVRSFLERSERTTGEQKDYPPTRENNVWNTKSARKVKRNPVECLHII